MTSVSFSAFLILIGALALLYVVTGLFLSQLGKERPAIYKEVAKVSHLYGSVFGILKFGLLYIIPLDYEKWRLSKKGRWTARTLFLLHLLYLIYLLVLVASLLELR